MTSRANQELVGFLCSSNGHFSFFLQLFRANSFEHLTQKGGGYSSGGIVRGTVTIRGNVRP